MTESRRPLRIAQIAATPHRSPWVADISAELTRRGFDVCAIIDTSAGDLSARLTAEGIRHFKVPMIMAAGLDRARLPFYLLRLPFSLLRLAWILRRERIDIAHSHIFVANMLTRFAHRLTRTRHVAGNAGPRHLEAPFTRAIDQLTYRLDDRFVGGCEYAVDLYRSMGVPEHLLACAYYGSRPEIFDPLRADRFKLRRELGIADDVPLVGLIAHFYPPTRGPQTPPGTRGIGLKGHEFFLEAARIVTQRFPEARFVLVGDGSNELGERFREALIAQSADLGDRVIFTGHRRDIVDTIAALDIAVQCSLTEGLGGTIQALMMERATIATRVGGMPEAVRHEETGLLVPPADAQALAAAIERMLVHPDEAARFAAAGRALMLSRFTLERTGADLSAVYEQMMDD